MKKIILPLLCFFAAAQAVFADEFKTTTMLSKPVGIFDTMIVTGPTVLKEVQIGAEPKDPKGFLQKQTLTVNGIFGILAPINVGGVAVDLPVAAGDRVLVRKSLEFKNGDKTSPLNYDFANINVHPNRLLTIGNNISLDALNAESIETTQTFTDVSTTSATLRNVSKSPEAPYYNIAGRIMETPKGKGDMTVWEDTPQIKGNSYGPWAFADNPVGLETCNGDSNLAYSCKKEEQTFAGRECKDVRTITIKNDIATAVYDDDKKVFKGGAMVFKTIGRREGVYVPGNGGQCMIGEYFVRDSNGNKVFACGEKDSGTSSLGSLVIAEGTNQLGKICHTICGGKPCESSAVCYDPKSVSILESHTDTSRTKWPEGTKLECHELWTEAVFQAVQCHAGAGVPACGPNVVSNSCVKYQVRDVTCKKMQGGGTYRAGQFLVLDYGGN